MLHSELEELSEGLEKLLGREQVSNLKVLVGKEKKVFLVNDVLLSSRLKKSRLNFDY